MSTGRPHTFLCPVYRREKRMDEPRSRHRTEPTGRSRKRRGRGSVRWGHVAYEYQCSCGHVGWSRHPDLAVKAKQKDSDEE